LLRFCRRLLEKVVPGGAISKSITLQTLELRTRNFPFSRWGFLGARV
jgi:hypothetical protein